VIQSEEKIKQRLIYCLKDIEWDIIQGKIDDVMTKLEEAHRLAQEWGEKKDLAARHARPNWPISSKLRVLKNYCFALVDCYRTT
jgi:hypothetical protein